MWEFIFRLFELEKSLVGKPFQLSLYVQVVNNFV